jgi:hypothetical protein
MIFQLISSCCNSDKYVLCGNYETVNNGSRSLFQCGICHQVFSETKGKFLAGLRAPVSLIIQVIKSRTEGIGLNAACRAFEIAKNTRLNWERRLAGEKDTLAAYALSHTFLSQLIEGDELYTKIGKNWPVEECEGWTIVLMERATHFIWALDCGKKDRDLFFLRYRHLSM